MRSEEELRREQLTGAAGRVLARQQLATSDCGCGASLSLHLPSLLLPQLSMTGRLPSVFPCDAASARQVDADGKARSYAHERGQWTCHVFAEGKCAALLVCRAIIQLLF